ncbi:Alpha/Beta hydrolase protein [Penicillium cinerascens]|uniref:Alpha/Beta hydrolase protein n=1 Tax=Penicillium cinerascens TaxID=70096 RepID=A0A9W9TFB3_9EURO|nr:Alpha/Beta hydrolase protein [Penicillium cinerascens]KAJ5219455.1 Alpha/Beta hydrolase protein [Penicillium cinerascens]
MSNTKIVHVPHLGGIEASYQMPRPYDPKKPTLVLVNSFTTSSELYRQQYANKELNDTMNLLAIELLGHGQTRTERENWTYWDTAEMNLQVLDALNIRKAFVLGTSQGGWITVRMALMRPDKISGIIPLGTSMDSETDITRSLNCWDAPTLLTPSIEKWTSQQPTPQFEADQEYCDFLIDIGFGKDDCPSDVRNFWRNTIRQNYLGDDGRRRLRMAAINLRDRDGLHPRLFDVQCPVMWLHGTKDVVYSVPNAEREIKLFVNSPDARLVTVQNGAHFLSASHPKEVDQALIQFVKKYSA